MLSELPHQLKVHFRHHHYQPTNNEIIDSGIGTPAVELFLERVTIFSTKMDNMRDNQKSLGLVYHPLVAGS